MNTEWGPLGELVFNRTYSRRIDDRHETWEETIKRVVRKTATFSKVSSNLQNTNN